MRRWALIAIALVILASAAGADDLAGTYTGTVSMHMKITATGQDMTATGPATVVITPSGSDFKVHITTELSDLPSTDETVTYKGSGSTITYTNTQEMGAMRMDSSGTFTLSGSSLTGTLSTTGKPSDGELQSQSDSTFTLTRSGSE